jgi:hypothetical protein
MKIRTEFTDKIGVDYPIIGAPMFLVSYERYVIALAEAGALGAFPLPNYRTTEGLKQALRLIRQETSKPIGVNIHLSGRFPWKEQLAICLDAGVSFFIGSLERRDCLCGRGHGGAGPESARSGRGWADRGGSRGGRSLWEHFHTGLHPLPGCKNRSAGHSGGRDQHGPANGCCAGGGSLWGRCRHSLDRNPGVGCSAGI